MLKPIATNCILFIAASLTSNYLSPFVFFLSSAVISEKSIMIETLVVSLLSILLAYLARYKQFRYGLEAAFIVITFFLAIRYNWGNDYESYIVEFNEINSNNVNIISNREIGWVIINRLSYSIGFFGLTILLTIFEYYVVYRLIKRYVPREWYWLSVFILTINTSYMLVGASMMRQFLSMCIFIVTIDFIMKKKWIISLLLVFLASLFHTSALILLPFCFFGFVDVSLSRKSALILFGGYVILYIISLELLDEIFPQIFIIEQFEKYQVYLYTDKLKSQFGLGVFFYMILFLTLILHQRFQDKKMRFLFIILAFDQLTTIFSGIVPLISRIGLYFSIFSIVCYPLLFKTMKNKFWKYSLLFGYIVLTIKIFISFFNPSSIWYYSFYHYKTIFSISEWL